MKAHILIFDHTQVDKNAFRDRLDRMESIENWTLFFGNSMCLASSKSARALSTEVRQAFPGVRFLITTVDPSQKGGWLPKDLWELMNQPSPADEPSSA